MGLDMVWSDTCNTVLVALIKYIIEKLRNIYHGIRNPLWRVLADAAVLAVVVIIVVFTVQTSKALHTCTIWLKEMYADNPKTQCCKPNKIVGAS